MKYLSWEVVAYLIAVVVANLTAAWILPIPITTVGTLLFGATFTLRDVVHARHGRRGVYATIMVAVAVSGVLAIGQTVEWRVIFASIIGMALAETADTEIFHHTSGTWLRRVLLSNSASVPLDTILFNTIAFGGVWGWGLWVSVSLGDIAAKWIIGYGVGYVRSHLLRGKKPTL